jgi:tetratricopeptide (TPR) repeat protein
MNINKHYFKSISKLLFVILFSSAIYSQPTQDTKTLFLEAESYYLFEEYKDALPLYQQLLAEDPENFNISFKIGICYLNNPYLKNKSISYLLKAAENIDPKCNPSSFRERKAPPEALYFLGNAYRINDRLDEAIDRYKEFLEILNPEIYDEELVKRQIKACEIAFKLKANPKYVISENLGDVINSQYSDINPVISGDGSSLIYTKKLRFYDAIFYSKKDSGKWTYPINLTPEFALDGNSYSTGISYEGDEIFAYRSDGYDGNIYASKLIDGKWSKLQKQNDNINTKYWESHASISSDGKTLYFTSNRKGGYGGLDIYKSERTDNGDWGPAENLGNVINSKYNEDTPFITTDGKTIYFSSLGHNNMGGYDIFYSTLSENGRWSTPVNLGPPVNTTGDDLFFAPGKNDQYAYYSIYKSDEVYGLNDIFKVEVFSERHPRKFVLLGKAEKGTDVKTDYDEIKVRLIEKYTNKTVDETSINNDGSYTLNATQGDFRIITEGDGVKMTSQEISIPIDHPADKIEIKTEIIAEVKVPAVEEDMRLTNPPELEINKDNYIVSSDEIIPIRLNLEKNTDLIIEIYKNGILINTENFKIKRKKFVYQFKPEQGTNLLTFKLTNDNGITNTHNVTVEYTPAIVETPVTHLDETTERLSTEELLKIVQFAEGDLKEYLDGVNWEKVNITSISELYNYLYDKAAKEKYDANELNKLFIDYLSSELDIDFIYQSLLLKKDENLTNILVDFDSQKKAIYTSGDLLNYLWDKALSSGYSDNDMMELLFSIKTDSYKNVDLFMRYLEKNATGNLKSVIQNLDIRERKISTFTDLLEYLVAQAKLKDYNREAVYQLLIDLIAPENLEGFVNILMKHADSEIKEALEDIDMDQFSKPLELVKYLIGHRDKYLFSETDILNLLLNIIFKKGFDLEDLTKDYDRISKKANYKLIISLVVANSIILLFIIFFIIRKRKKNSIK